MANPFEKKSDNMAEKVEELGNVVEYLKTAEPDASSPETQTEYAKNHKKYIDLMMEISPRLTPDQLEKFDILDDKEIIRKTLAGFTTDDAEKEMLKMSQKIRQGIEE